MFFPSATNASGKCRKIGPRHQTGNDLSLSMDTFMDRKVQELGLIDSYRGEVMNPHYTHERIARDDAPSSEPDELYRRKVGYTCWSVLGLRFDVSFTQNEFSRVFNQHNAYAERTILLRTLAYLIRTKDARILMESDAMHDYEPPPTRRRHDDPSLYEIAARYNLDAQDSAIPSPDNEHIEQQYLYSAQPVQLVFDRCRPRWT